MTGVGHLNICHQIRRFLSLASYISSFSILSWSRKSYRRSASFLPRLRISDRTGYGVTKGMKLRCFPICTHGWTVI
jgi:hypothetical protein